MTIRKNINRRKIGYVDPVEIDSGRHSGYPGDNVFESGSRHPKWRGGVDSKTLRARQRQYREHGVGVVTAGNSQAAQLSGEVAINRKKRFISGVSNLMVVGNITSPDDCLAIINILLNGTGRLLAFPTPRLHNTTITINTDKYVYTFSIRESSSRKVFNMRVRRSLAVKATSLTERPALAAPVKKHKKKRAPSNNSQKQSRVDYKHANHIRGLEDIVG